MYSFGGSSIARGYTGDEVDIGEGLMNYFLNFLYYNDPNGAPEGEQTSSSTVNVAVPEITFQTTGNQTIRTNWPTYGSPDTLNSLHFLVGNTTVIQDTFRWARMAIFENEDTAAALLYKREDDE
jgi:hypothetical protein